jgi:hypothetical protein
VVNRRISKGFRYAWAAPWSLVGLLLSPLFKRRVVVRGVLLAEGAAWPARLGWRYRAITFGHVVLSVDELDRGTLGHELVHVHQYERWGPLFVPAYLMASLRALARGNHHYRDNAFEVAARDLGSGRSRHEA